MEDHKISINIKEARPFSALKTQRKTLESVLKDTDRKFGLYKPGRYHLNDLLLVGQDMEPHSGCSASSWLSEGLTYCTSDKRQFWSTN